MTYGRWHCGKTLALNQTHSGGINLITIFHIRKRCQPGSDQLMVTMPVPRKGAQGAEAPPRRTRATVMMLLAVMDPAGSRQRRMRRLQRRRYWNQGPNWCWHIDGYDKLKPYGFPIHACIDGVLKAGGLGSGLSKPHGGLIFSRYNAPIYSNYLAIMHSGNCQSLVEDGFYDPTITLQRHIAAYVFEPLLRKELHEFKERWNQHRIRYNRHAVCPGGVPDDLYTLSDDCKQDIDPDVLAFLLVKYGCDAPGFDPEEFGALASHFLAIVQLTQDEITPTNYMDSTSRRDKSPEDKSRSSFTPQVRAAVRRFINEVDQEEREPISKKKVSTIEGLCAAYQDSVKNKRTGDPSGSNAAKKSREEKENGHARTPPAETITMKKKNKSDGYKRQGEVHRVSGFMHEDNYDTTLRKAVAPLLDKAANYNKCHLVMAGGRVSNLPLISKQRPWSLGGFMEELGGFEKGKRLVIGVYVPNDDTTITDHSDKDILISPPRAISLASSEPSQALNLPKPVTARERLNELDLTEDGLLVPLEKIEIGAKIGGGTFGSVHKGMLFGTDVAIKIVTIPEGDVKREAMKEVEILKKLRHPNIVNLMGVCYEVSQLLLVTNYIDGSNLHQIIFYNSCDVTSSDLHVFVCDLGVAKLQSKLAIHKTSRGPGAGTVAYKAPEMFRDSRRSTPVDIYSFGCVIIELFTGKRVWGELDTCQITCKILGTREDDPQTPSCEEVPEEHREICARSTALDGSDRPSAQEMLEYFKLQ
ncbi:hypothetical protein EMCRGX_G006465 [Ephydatia muelleri]